MIYILLDEFNVITSYSIKLSDNQVFSDEWIVIDTDIDLDLLVFNYKYIDGELIELPEEEKQRYLNTVRPITLEEKVQLQEDKINILKEENEKQDELIDTTLLATDEMYMMLEPLLASQVNLTSEYISRMAAMYVAMVQRGLKTIDEVPVRYREEVRAIIEN